MYQNKGEDLRFPQIDKLEKKSDEDIDNITTSEESYNSQVNYIYIYILKDYLSDGDFDYKDEYFDLD